MPYAGELPQRANGSLIAFETGEAVAYGLYNAQERGTLFIDPGTPVYAGMVVGVSAKPDDLAVNVCKKKARHKHAGLRQRRGAAAYTPRRMSLEESLEFLREDEMLEVTPKTLRIRKRILDHAQRMRELKSVSS